MSVNFTVIARACSGLAIAAALACAPLPLQAQARGPFAGLSGNWAGNGSISVSNGATERIRCRVSYEVSPSGTNLNQQMRCASDSYKFEVRSNLVYAGGTLTGTWTEITRNATGNVSGRVNGAEIQTHVDGPGFTADLAVVTRGDRQSVSIRPQGADITAVTVDLRRS